VAAFELGLAVFGLARRACSRPTITALFLAGVSRSPEDPVAHSDSIAVFLVLGKSARRPSCLIRHSSSGSAPSSPPSSLNRIRHAKIQRASSVMCWRLLDFHRPDAAARTCFWTTVGFLQEQLAGIPAMPPLHLVVYSIGDKAGRAPCAAPPGASSGRATTASNSVTVRFYRSSTTG